jgi:hypothetical protein
MSREELFVENKKCWDGFYSWQAIRKRLKGGYLSSRPWSGRVAYICFCLGFKRMYSGHGTSPDAVRRRRIGFTTRFIVKFGLAVYSYIYRRKLGLRVPLLRPGPAQPT